MDGTEESCRAKTFFFVFLFVLSSFALMIQHSNSFNDAKNL